MASSAPKDPRSIRAHDLQVRAHSSDRACCEMPPQSVASHKVREPHQAVSPGNRDAVRSGFAQQGIRIGAQFPGE
jgi:hypothetical protein